MGNDINPTWQLDIHYQTTKPRFKRYRYQPFELRLNVEWTAMRTGLFGPSGCGKSSLLEVIVGLKPQSQVKGFAKLGHRTFFSTAEAFWPHLQSRRLGWVPQAAYLFPHLNARENILFACNQSSQTPALDDLIKVLELDGLMEKYPWQLSGGEQQRVALGRALMADCETLLLDEPLSNLDKTRRQQLLACIRRVSEQWRKPLIFVSHEWSEIEALCEHVLILSNGTPQQHHDL